MSDIFVTIRNQDGNAMTSVDGVIFLAILRQDGTTIARKPVNLRYADAQFANLEPGEYIVRAFHQSINSSEASQEIVLEKQELLEVRFIHLKPERQLLTISINRYPFSFNILLRL